MGVEWGDGDVCGCEGGGYGECGVSGDGVRVGRRREKGGEGWCGGV